MSRIPFRTLFLCDVPLQRRQTLLQLILVEFRSHFASCALKEIKNNVEPSTDSNNMKKQRESQLSNLIQLYGTETEAALPPVSLSHG